MNTIKRHDYTKYFEYGYRKDESKYVRCKEGIPEVLSDFIREVHTECFDCWPNDWIYGVIWEAFDELEENEIDDITIESDPYYAQLYKWFGEPYAASFIDEAIEQGICDSKQIYKMIEFGQFLAKDRIYRMVDEFINAQGESNE